MLSLQRFFILLKNSILNLLCRIYNKVLNLQSPSFELDFKQYPFRNFQMMQCNLSFMEKQCGPKFNYSGPPRNT